MCISLKKLSLNRNRCKRPVIHLRIILFQYKISLLICIPNHNKSVTKLMVYMKRDAICIKTISIIKPDDFSKTFDVDLAGLG